MEELIGNAQALIAMYLPIILSLGTQIASFVVTFVKLKGIKIKEDINAGLSDTSKEIELLVGEIRTLIKENEDLKKANKVLIEKITHIEQVEGAIYD